MASIDKQTIHLRVKTHGQARWMLAVSFLVGHSKNVTYAALGLVLTEGAYYCIHNGKDFPPGVLKMAYWIFGAGVIAAGVKQHLATRAEGLAAKFTGAGGA